MALSIPFIFLALGISRCSASIINNVSDLNKLGLTFDFIVLGGGTAGNVIANRLSENSSNQVLVLEAGGANVGVLDVEVPFFCSQATPNTAQDWNYTTTPQTGLGGRTINYVRGFGLGGSSAVNYMGYTRGSKEDYDRFATVTGDQGWSWNSLIPYMKKNEQFSLHTQDNHNITGQFDPTVHGFTGINSVSLPGFATPEMSARVLKATTESTEYPFNLDMNSGSPLGFGWVQTTINNGSRSTSATSYLAPQFINRPNLHVLLDARVTRVLPTATGVFRTVEFVQALTGPKFNLTAKKEIILSAGSVGTPNILLHSGIGDSSALKSLGITPLHNLPSVGKNMTDHTLLFLSFEVNNPNTWETFERNATLGQQALAQWTNSKTGPLVDIPASQLGFLRADLEGQFPDPAAGPTTPHFEFLVGNGFFGPPPATGNYMSVVPALVAPTARGSITIGSSDPLAAPLINPNLLGSASDSFVMRQAVKSALRFASLPAWNGYVISSLGVNSNSTDAELDTYIRANAASVYHLAGSASMSPVGATWGVVDPDLVVKGLTGLRIVDLSVVPFIPSAHTQAATYIIAERAADLIKAAWAFGGFDKRFLSRRFSISME
ncbi:alcohol oxidase [Mycena rosella]|uniref:Alcohol oxidase n=1 Tax=Mycena rosella TaxID=1033263 RepID=A0AAD7E0D8_MYCRO|nr:alcohol oxidase [Mycena rosella]